MQLLSVNNLNTTGVNEEDSLKQVDNPETFIISIILSMNNIKLTSGLVSKVKEDMGYDLPVIEDLPLKFDSDKQYDTSLLDILSFVIAERRGETEINKVIEEYNKYQKEMNKLRKKYGDEARKIVKDGLKKSEEVIKLSKIYS